MYWLLTTHARQMAKAEAGSNRIAAFGHTAGFDGEGMVDDMQALVAHFFPGAAAGSSNDYYHVREKER